jgi:hypothetical protein
LCLLSSWIFLFFSWCGCYKFESPKLIHFALVLISSINRLPTKVQIHETLNTCSCGVGSGFVLDSIVIWTCMHK